MAFFSEDRQSRLRSTFQIVNDINEQIAYLRSSVIGSVSTRVHPCLSRTRARNTGRNFRRSAHQAHRRRSGSRLQSLCGNITEKNLPFAGCTGHRAGRLPYHQHFAGIDGRCRHLRRKEKAYSELLTNRVSDQYNIKSPVLYERIQAVLDYISGMTDVFALDLYRKINGNSLPAV